MVVHKIVILLCNGDVYLPGAGVLGVLTGAVKAGLVDPSPEASKAL